MDPQSPGKDAELDGMPEALHELMKKSRMDMSHQQKKESAAEIEEHKRREEQLHAITYAYVPKEGFDWDNVSGGI